MPTDTPPALSRLMTPSTTRALAAWLCVHGYLCRNSTSTHTIGAGTPALRIVMSASRAWRAPSLPARQAVSLALQSPYGPVPSWVIWVAVGYDGTRYAPTITWCALAHDSWAPRQGLTVWPAPWVRPRMT